MKEQLSMDENNNKSVNNDMSVNDDKNVKNNKNNQVDITIRSKLDKNEKNLYGLEDKSQEELFELFEELFA